MKVVLDGKSSIIVIMQNLAEYILKQPINYTNLRNGRNYSTALLKARSPACGKGRVYDGSFTGTTTARDGVAAELLLAHGIAVFGEDELEKLI